MVLLKSYKIFIIMLGTNGSTFHYGSIKMLTLLSLKCLHRHLHSTMVLLKSISICVILLSFNESTFHYGSIKIDEMNTIYKIDKKSTFHYGSIKIFFLCMLTYALFLIYIPLWFY